MSSRRSWRLVGALTLALTVAAGCASADAAGEQAPAAAQTRVFSADNGEITVPVAPQRVVATGYAVPALIEADAPLVGISTWDRGLPLMTPEDLATYQGLEKIAGGQAAETNYEAIAAVRPDLIVIGVPGPALADIDMDRLESLAPVVAIGPSLPSAWRELSRRQADAAGRLEAFDQAEAAYEAEAAELAETYRPVLSPLRFGHLGAYGEIADGTFQREFAGSWGTNIAEDIGVNYYGEVKEKRGGAGDVSEYPSIEELPVSFAEADAITYTVDPDGSVPEAVQYVLDTELWKNLPAVRAGRVFPLRYTEAATYTSAQQTLDAIDAALRPLLG
ncbi:ABC transporter substrate-binding protein [Pseudonocardia lacus]|uniref:ABC transporter substrate-binding protein n=1 Tax=Pseudonocardia lacus TaxID=2835865 RepID=UPI001BDC87EB|nr:ABC transporter substrate-binding protein [Pseudonocardia lacus]